MNKKDVYIEKHLIHNVVYNRGFVMLYAFINGITDSGKYQEIQPQLLKNSHLSPLIYYLCWKPVQRATKTVLKYTRLMCCLFLCV